MIERKILLLAGMTLVTWFQGLAFAVESEQSSALTPVQEHIEAVKLKASDYRLVEWTDLMPADDLEALMNPPSYLEDIEDGSYEDQIAAQMQNVIEAASDDRYQRALVSTRVVNEFDQQNIRIPGFIVPLEFDDKQTITEFFLVPFFGACIHLPPPPPNQTIFVQAADGIKIDAIYDPFWITGRLRTELIQNDMAAAAYKMQLHEIEVYTE